MSTVPEQDAPASYKLDSLTKTFPGVRAVDAVSLEVLNGEIHGLIGKNGAGKSVLVNMIAGALQSSSGDIWIGEQRVDRHYSPTRALELGVALIPQEPIFAPLLSVMDNLFMGQPIKSWLGLIDYPEMESRAQEIIEQLGVDARPHHLMRDLSIEDQQLLAFGKALFLEESRVILLDEITASLPRDRKTMLLQFLREALENSQDISFTLISHHIGEVMEFCDRVSVMHDGNLVATVDTSETNEAQLAEWVVGGQKSEVSRKAAKRYGDSQDEVVLKMDRLAKTDLFEAIDLEVSVGEVVGIAGLEGSGKDAVLDALFGIISVDSGTITVSGKRVRLSSPIEAMRNGIAYLPKKREEQAVIHGRSVEENILLPIYSKLRNGAGLIDHQKSRQIAQEGIDTLNVKTPSMSTDIDQLSGGNRQKVMINRIVSTEPLIFLLNEPTRGVDIGTKPEILNTIRNRLADRSAVLLTSESEEELVEICDRIIPFYRGKMMRVLSRDEPDFNVARVYEEIQGISKE